MLSVILSEFDFEEHGWRRLLESAHWQQPVAQLGIERRDLVQRGPGAAGVGRQRAAREIAAGLERIGHVALEPRPGLRSSPRHPEMGAEVKRLVEQLLAQQERLGGFGGGVPHEARCAR